jgi:hypothetical protein
LANQNQRCGLFYFAEPSPSPDKWSDSMIEILWVMAQLLLVAVVAGVIGGGAVGLVAAEVANWWYEVQP